MCVVNGLSLVGNVSVCRIGTVEGYRRPSSFTPCKQVSLLKRERYEERDSSPTTLTNVPCRAAPPASCFRQFQLCELPERLAHQVQGTAA